METADKILRAYLETALWCATDENGNPLDRTYSVRDFAPEAIAEARADCAAFYEANRADVDSGPLRCGPDYTADERAGHDFYLTRNGHGAGFWDGDWPEDAGQRLTDAAHVYGTAGVYAGDDGKLYFHG